MKPSKLCQFCMLAIAAQALALSSDAFAADSNTLQFTAASVTPEGAFRLTWQSQSYLLYRVESAETLNNPPPWRALYDRYPSQGTLTTCLDTNPSSAARFYRLINQGFNTSLLTNLGMAIITNFVCYDPDNAVNWSVRSNLQTGDLMYGDRTYTITTLPNAWIRTACSSKAGTTPLLCTFDVTADATVYVVHNDLISPRPSWLTNFTDSNDNLVSSDADGPNFSIFSRDYAAGSTVWLGVNGSTGETCYSIIAKQLISFPSAPAGLSATASDGLVSLTWNPAAGTAGYYVKRAIVSGGPYGVIATNTATGYTNSGLTNGTTYYYVVSGFNAYGEGADSSQASATPSPASAPAAPTGLSAIPGSGQVALSWTASSGATSYHVKRAATNGGPYTPVLTNTITSCTNAESANSSQAGAGLGDFYASPSGNDVNPGTYAQPFKTIELAYSAVCNSAVPAGKLVFFRGGTYQSLHPANSTSIDLEAGVSGTAGNLIKCWAYPGETPVINLSNITAANYTIWGLRFTGNYWHWKGFEVTGLPAITWLYVHQAFIARSCNYCIFENFKVHDNWSMGFCLGGDNCNGNLILNCDAYNNADPETTTDPWGNADGIHIGTDTNLNSTNFIVGCRSWYNSDDGYDGYNDEGRVLYTNCWSLFNGFRTSTNLTLKGGDGVGFKFGNSVISNAVVRRTAFGCISACNNSTGFDLNDGMFAVELSQCLSYSNHNHGLYFSKFNEPNQFKNCVSIFSGSGYDALTTSQSTVVNCTWVNTPWSINSGHSTAASFATNFVSVDVSQLLGARKSDNSLPDITCFQLKTNSAYHYQ